MRTEGNPTAKQNGPRGPASPTLRASLSLIQPRSRQKSYRIDVRLNQNTAGAEEHTPPLAFAPTGTSLFLSQASAPKRAGCSSPLPIDALSASIATTPRVRPLAALGNIFHARSTWARTVVVVAEAPAARTIAAPAARFILAGPGESWR